MSGVSIDGGSRADRLLALAQAFANDMTERIGRIVPVSVRFSALATGSDTKYRVMVAVLDETFKAQSIPLAIGGKAKLRFLVKSYCCWDRSNDYLAVHESWFHVRLEDRKRDEPLFRYEYLRNATTNVPSSHIQVHAHRDEFLYLLVAAEKARLAGLGVEANSPEMGAGGQHGSAAMLLNLRHCP
jgi:hypothetical protein